MARRAMSEEGVQLMLTALAQDDNRALPFLYLCDVVGEPNWRATGFVVRVRRGGFMVMLPLEVEAARVKWEYPPSFDPTYLSDPITKRLRVFSSTLRLCAFRNQIGPHLSPRRFTPIEIKFLPWQQSGISWRRPASCLWL